MNPWDIVGTIAGWIGVLFLSLVALVFAIVLIGVTVQFGKKLVTRKPKKPYPLSQPSPTIALDDYMAEATIVARSMHDNDQLGLTRIEAFRAGARWAWSFSNRQS